MQFTSLDACDKAMLKECMRHKRPLPHERSSMCDIDHADRIGEPTMQDGTGARAPGSGRSSGEAGSGETGREEDRRLALTETLRRGGLSVMPPGTAQHALFASGANLLQRPFSSKGSEAHTSSSDALPTGVINSANGRHSRRSGRSSHAVAKRMLGSDLGSDLAGSASGSWSVPVDGRNSSLAGSLTRAFSSSGSLLGLACAPHQSSARSLSAAAARSLRAIDTPPCAPNAFEVHQTLVKCPPPLRSQLHATRATLAYRCSSESSL